ncbi:MAG: endonuclease III [Muribaculaceae bacterium]|nr:endonuclease III [Muribaculaceae bacterium]
MTTKQRFLAVIKYFSQAMPEAKTELNYESPYQLLVAVILSAQCTDKRVNLITPAFFRAFPSVYHLAKASTDDIFQYIRSISYPNNKSKSLLGMANMIVDVYNGNVPDNFDDLIKIPGVGRKTANVILSVVFNKDAMAVDTHVFRVANRIGLTNDSPNPLTTEKTLVKYFPAHLLGLAHHWLILHGRYTCTARSPKCLDCGISQVCKFYNSSLKTQK